MARLQKATPLKVAIQINNQHHMLSQTDILSPRTGTGFVTSDKAALYQDRFILKWTVYPLAFFVTFLLVAILFFVDRRSIYLAGLALSFALINLRTSEPVFTVLTGNLNVFFASFFAWTAVVFTCWAGIELMGLNHRLVRRFFPIVFVAPIVVFLVTSDSHTRASFWLTSQLGGLVAADLAVALALIAKVALRRRGLRTQIMLNLGIATCFIVMALTRALVPKGPTSMFTEFHHHQFIELLAFVALGSLLRSRKGAVSQVEEQEVLRLSA
jgi:hypothetical protein